MPLVYRYPLEWPAGWPRTRTSAARGHSAFKVSGAAALRDLERVAKALDLGAIITTNVPLSRKGKPYAEDLDLVAKHNAEMNEAGVSVFWTRYAWGEKKVELAAACDLYRSLRDNVRALTLALDGLRAMERAGVKALADRAYSGFQALPATASSSSHPRRWWEVLRLEDPAIFAAGRHPAIVGDIIHARYHELALIHHPDRGGRTERMQEINEAYEAAKKWLANGMKE